MRLTRVSGLLMPACLVVAMVVRGDVGRVLLVASFVAAAACVVGLVMLARDGRPVRGLLALATVFALLYIGGGVYLMYWSPETDIGGVFPFLIGIIGMLGVSVTLAVTSLDGPRD